jgi:UDP-N-acetylmuramate dehydrogenase
MSSLLARELGALLGNRAQFGLPLSSLTTWKVGGPAWCVCRLHNLAEAQKVLTILANDSVPFMPLGNGSNLLASDAGYPGVLLKLEGQLRETRVREEVIEAGGGAMLDQVLGQSARAGLCGLEWAAAIPATIGGAIAMNAGSWGKNIFTCLRRLTLLSGKGELISLDKPALPAAAYRNGNLPGASIVAEAAFELLRGDCASVQRTIADNIRLKSQRLPLAHPSAGSVFMNPEGDFAGRLIESAGLKGKKQGNAQISDIHGNFIVNLGGAKADDIYKLIVTIRDEVARRFGIRLTLEIKLIGYAEVQD